MIYYFKNYALFIPGIKKQDDMRDFLEEASDATLAVGHPNLYSKPKYNVSVVTH